MKKNKTVENEGPASARWGFGNPAHPRISAVIENGIADFHLALQEICIHKSVLHGIPQRTDSPVIPNWHNPLFSTLDAAALVGFIMSRRPTRYLEIGSGYSTKFARHAVNTAQISTHITSVDPNPRVEIDGLCDRVIRKSLQDCDLSMFEHLNRGDFLFFDGSHRVGINSDVTVFFLEILPSLKPGILVHVHDIFWPFDYVPRFHRRGYSEQYMLGMLLVAKPVQIKTVLPNYFACGHPELGKIVHDLFAPPPGRSGIPFVYSNHPLMMGTSYWFETL